MEDKFEILEHTSDLRILARGRNSADLFTNMLQGMFSAMRPQKEEGSEPVERSFGVESEDRETLLVDFLNEALYQSEVNQEMYEGSSFTKLTDREARGVLLGWRRSAIGAQVKAATYHDLHFFERPDGVIEATVIFDI